MKPLFRSPTGSASLGPVPGSEFHNVRPGHLHGGIDLNAPMWHPIIAPRSGTIAVVGVSSGLGGNKIEIDHGIVYGHRHYTKHYHFGYKYQPWEECIVVREGQTVKAGDLLGYCGISGNASAPHDHYEHLVDDRPLDPLQFLREYQVVRRPLLGQRYSLIYYRSEGPDIPTLQLRLIKRGYLTGPVDDVYGYKTLAAVKAFQISRGLQPDGIVGKLTWQALL